MSTRWYPLYQKGNPQLRIFLPNFWMKLIKPIHKQPPNVVQFHCSMEMTKHDIKNYLEKIYNVKPLQINTVICMGRFKRDAVKGIITKEDDCKLAYAVLPKEQIFVFPDLFKDVKDIFDDMSELKQNLQDYVDSNKAPGSLTWFRI